MRLLVGLAVVVGCSTPGAQRVPAAALPYDPGFVASSQRLRATLARDNIELDTQPVITTCDPGDTRKNCARCDVATVLDQIEPELVDQMAIAFARYPSSVRKTARLEHVAFCRAITYVRGTDHGPAGLADPNAHRVYISVEYFRGAGSNLSIESAVHHEVFHLLDYETLHREEDPAWAALNPKGFAYVDPSVGWERPKGFVNTYATTNQMEDRASTWEYLMVQPDDLCDMAAKDPVVAKKVRAIWQRVVKVEGANRLGVSARCALKAEQPTKPTKPTTRRTPKKPNLQLPTDW
ncbi:MAG TPA: hypothetical protein VFV99_18865 [Kofleriaceae bacterium]|nr:hypothetical protein [Kofleriaceae bacterium]